MNIEACCRYFLEGLRGSKGCLDEKVFPKFGFGADECKLIGLRDFFGKPDLKCSHYETVVSGEGNEQDKIDTVYSSSLQSFLCFDSVSPLTPITMRFPGGPEMVFDEVYFEYENQVIGYPSSVDVVLVNRKSKSISFVESKLLEIVRDSTPVGSKVVGPSYFRKKGPGYHETLGLTLDELNILRIAHEFKGDAYPLKKVRGQGYEYQAIEPLNGHKYVYSEGIKQILSHLIGIKGFRKIDAYENDPIQNHRQFENVFYLELYNALPGFGEAMSVYGAPNEDAQAKIEDFKAHFSLVKNTLSEKESIKIGMFMMTYQDLFGAEDNKRLINDEIKAFYHL